MSSKPIRRRLVLRRNVIKGIAEIFERTSTVSTDSMNGNPPNTCRMTRWKIVRDSKGDARVLLGWEFRDTWTMQEEPGGQVFQVYHHTPHKYWLRRLVRMCR